MNNIRKHVWDIITEVAAQPRHQAMRTIALFIRQETNGGAVEDLEAFTPDEINALYRLHFIICTEGVE